MMSDFSTPHGGGSGFPSVLNPLKTRDDAARSLIDLLAPLKRFAVPGGFYLGNFTAHYSPKVALMEGWSRSLWGLAPLIAGGTPFPDTGLFLSLLKEGVNPAAPGYWGEPPDCDQRLVEMAAMSLALIIARRHFWDALNETEQTNLYRWLSSIEKRELPGNNWHFFRVMVCLAFRELGLPVDEAAERASLDLIESCYRENGWYEDGENGHFDLYNPWAFHFYGLVYAKAAGGRDPERAERFVRRARLFARRFVRWFREDGSMAAFGRSLTYRFAALSFWSACAFAGVEALPWGVMKGIVLRGLRNWFARPILDASGVLTVGYGYPNLVMADWYNSPGSPYWALKAYLILALGEDHPFWQAEEAPLPRLPALEVDSTAGFLSARNPEDTQLFPAAFASSYDMNHAVEKYCKFAYSARFGFCVSHSPGSIAQMGCDSMLFVRPRAEGPAAFWHGRRGVTERHFEGERLCCLWEPLKGVKIYTTLEVTGAWHIRTHRIESAFPLETFEGGFSLPRNEGFAEAPAVRNAAGSVTEALAAFPWGGSRIAALETESCRRGELVISAPNLNVLFPQAVVPALRGELPAGASVLVTAVRAGDKGAVETEALPGMNASP